MSEIGVFPSLSQAGAAAGARRAVIVDDDPDHCAMLLLSLAERGFTVVIAHGWLEALTVIGRDSPRLAVLRRDGDSEGCARAVALAKMLYPDTLVIETADRLVDGGDIDGENILRRPVSLNGLDHFLFEAGLSRQV